MRLYDAEIMPLYDPLPAQNGPLPHLKLMGFDYLWPYYTGKGTVVAIIDSGCDINHDDLKSRIIGGHCFIPGRSPDDINDENGHGTHVAGIIAANGKIKGGAYDARLLILRVFDAGGTCSTGAVAQAVAFATTWRGPNGEKVNIINMSLGGPERDRSLEAAINSAVMAGIMVICAAGNSGDGNDSTVEIDYPAAFDNSFSVGAVNLNLKSCYFTNANNQVDVAAPGDNILSTYTGARYCVMSGTSMACPCVSAFAACMIDKFVQKNGRLPTLNELRAVIGLMTIDIGKLGYDYETGLGFVSILPGVSLLKAG